MYGDGGGSRARGWKASEMQDVGRLSRAAKLAKLVAHTRLVHAECSGDETEQTEDRMCTMMRGQALQPCEGSGYDHGPIECAQEAVHCKGTANHLQIMSRNRL